MSGGARDLQRKKCDDCCVSFAFLSHLLSVYCFPAKEMGGEVKTEEVKKTSKTSAVSYDAISFSTTRKLGREQLEEKERNTIYKTSGASFTTGHHCLMCHHP